MTAHEHRTDDGGSASGYAIPRWRGHGAWLVPAAITLSWVGFVAARGHVERVVDHWAATVTMVFGSLVAGATPQGGGAVAFPVLTKVLEVPAAPARTFSLTVQAVGMGAVAAVLVLARRRIEWRAVVLAAGGGLAGLVLALALLTDTASAFRESLIPAPYVRVMFTVALAASSMAVVLVMRRDRTGVEGITWTRGRMLATTIGGLAGGLVAALTGTGVDVAVFLIVVHAAGLHPRVGVPTSVVAMAIVSVAAAVVLGLVDGQLDVRLDALGQVVAVGGQATPPLQAARYDLYGLWLAAVPAVVWGAPVGAALAATVSKRALAIVVGGMAMAEVATTALLLQPLRDDPQLRFVAVGALVGAGVILGIVDRRVRARADS